MLRCTKDRFPFAAALAVAMAAVLVGCSGNDARQCVTNDECASGLCRADGTCAVDVDGGADGDGTTGEDAAPIGCTPNHDGTVERSEVLLAAGRTATFKVATDVVFDTAGTAMPNDERRWDLSVAFVGDADVPTELVAPDGQWFAPLFPTATYTTPLSASSPLLGVFEIRSDALLLLGVVSPEDGITRTELTYDPPITVLPFPLASDATFSTDAQVSGLASGVVSFYSESYAQTVDAIGELDTPFGEFPVVRVHTELTRTVGLLVTTVHSFAFVSECYGIVGQVVSRDNEAAVEFTDAAELRRLTP